MKLLSKVRDFAIAAHGPQKYGDRPYSYHLDHVAKIVSWYGEMCQAVAYLHDVLEDTKFGAEHIAYRFGWEIAKQVEAITDPLGSNRGSRKKLLYEKIRRLNPSDYEEAFIVKAADRLSNLGNCAEGSTLYNMYCSEHNEFKSALYIPGFCDDIWNGIDEIVGLE